MKRKLLAGFMAVCLILTLLPATALAADTYTEWTTEDNLPTSGTYRLETDVTLTKTITIGGWASSVPAEPAQTLVLDLNGHTVTMDGGYLYVQTNGGLTIEDSVGTGKITNEGATGYGAQLVMVAGAFTMTGGTVENHRSNSNAVFLNGSSYGTLSGGTISNVASNGTAVFVNSQADFTMEDGTISNSVDGGDCLYVNTDATFTMNDGLVEQKGSYGSDAAIYNNGDNGDGTIEITGGTVASGSMGVYAPFSPVEVTGGSFETASYAFQTRYTTIDPDTDGDVFVKSETGVFYSFRGSENAISGGEFDAPQLVKEYTTEDPSTLTITGGVFENLDDSASAPINTEIVISSGKFTNQDGAPAESVKDYVAPGMAQDENGNIVVSDDAVAMIDGTPYLTLQDAVDAAVKSSGETTITLRKNASGDGVKVPSGSNIVFDLNTFTYDVSGQLVGSPNTETNGFQLLRDSTITFKNGTITSSKAKILIQNYSDLTLDHVKLDSTNPGATNYTLSNNFGDVKIADSTIIAPAGGYAFDVYYWPKNGYTEGVSVTVEGDSYIDGNIEYGSDDSDTANVAQKASLIIKDGKFTGAINTYGLAEDEKTGIAISGGNFAQPVNEDYIVPGMMRDETTGSIVVDTSTSVAIVDGVGYTTLAAAIDALKDGSVMKILPGKHDVTTTRTSDNTYGSGFIIDEDNVTIQAADPNNKPVLYGFSNKFSAGVYDGGINGQDTIYVSGENVTLENLKIMPLGGYKDGGGFVSNGQKTVEVTSTATGFTMTGCETMPNSEQKDKTENSMSTAAGNIHVSINDAKISGNSFGVDTTISAGWVGTDPSDTYSVDVSGNYWGDGVTGADIADKIDGNVKVNDYYTNAAMTTTADIGGIPVSNDTQLQAAINVAKDGDTIVLAPGIYNKDVSFGGKSLTIKAQYPAYKNGVVEDDSKLSVFTGTMSTYKSDSDMSITDGQSVTIEGIKFRGDGLKIGDSSYSTVDNLAVRYCIMECGDNLTSNPAVAGRYGNAKPNYFVKTQGNEYASSVVVEENYIYGEPAESVTPIQLWMVENATVRNNKIELTNAQDHEAINISKLPANAEVEVSGNTISGVGGGIYVTTWRLGGNPDNAEEAFEGTVTVKDNILTCEASETLEPIFVGYETNAASSDTPYGTIGKDARISATGNTNNGSDVAAVIVAGPADETPAVYVVTVKDDGEIVDQKVVANGDTYTLPTRPYNPYYMLKGWSDGSKTYDVGDKVTITKDTVFTAQWEKTSSGGGSSSGGSSSSSSGDYSITVDAGKHGDVSVSPKRADKGDTVTITVDPDKGYEVDEVIVTDKDGDSIRVRDRGDGEYTFTMPDSKVTVEVTFVEASGELSFVDVAKSDYYYDAVKWAVENGVTTGVTDTIFAPGNPCTRAQTVTFLWRAAGMPQAANRVNPFTDVSVNDYYYEAVLWAVENGITGGTTATTFSPNATCTRAQVVTFLWRYSKEDASILPMFTDVAESDYYYGAVAWAVENGVTTGVTDTTFAPGNPCTRGQIVTFLYRYMGK